MDYFLTIAASDNSGGAGIQQDIKVAQALGYWPLSAITGITVQNFRQVFELEATPSRCLKAQIEQCFLSFPLKAVKIGALCSAEHLAVIVDCLKRFPQRPVILDPVLFATDGTPFLNEAALHDLKCRLFPLTDLITPNKQEFELLARQCCDDLEEAIGLAQKKCLEWQCSILLKGGHFDGAMIKEALVTARGVFRFERERKSFPYAHGTGCTLSSALASYLGKGQSLEEAYHLASQFLVEYYEQINKKMADE